MLKGEGGECPAGANRGVSPLLKLNEFLVFTLCCLHPEILQDVHLDIVSYYGFTSNDLGRRAVTFQDEKQELNIQCI